MPAYAELEQRKNQLIRKALQGSAFVAPYSADPISALTGPDSLLTELPDLYEDLGWLSEDGLAYARDVATSDITSFGSTTPTRSDVTSDSSTLTVTAQETKLRTIELGTGANLSAITPPASGEVKIDKPERPSSRYYRVLGLAVDGDSDGDEIYIARFMPRAKVTSYAEQTFTSGDTPITWGVTFTSFVDSTLGFAESWIFGGPGWKKALTDMGFPAAAGA